MSKKIITCLALSLVLMCTPILSWAQGINGGKDAEKRYTNADSLYVNELNCRGNMSKSQVLSTAKRLSTEVNDGKLDVVFVIDSTGSMGEEIGSIVSNINDFARTINEAGFDYRIAIIDYKDITEGEVVQIVSYKGEEWLKTVSEIQAALNSIYVDGGGDDDETPIEAFGYMLENLSFRSNAGKMAVLFTDAGYKIDNNYGYDSLSDLANTLKAKTIMTSVVSNTYYEWDYESLFENTGGIFIDIDDAFSSELIQLAEYYKLYVLPDVNVDSGFKLKKDNNSFSHSDRKNAGFSEIKTYVLDNLYYKKLVKNATKAEKDSIKKQMNSEWGGSCYGIAATMGLVAEGYLKIRDISNKSVASYYKMAPPYKNRKLLNSINYYQLSQYLNSYSSENVASEICYPKSFFEKLFNWDSINEGLVVCLMKMVEAAKKGDVLQLCYSYREGWFSTCGHAILITGVKYDDDNKRYVLKLYDENGDDFIDMYVDKNFKSFNFTDANGDYIDEDTFCSMYFFDYSKLKPLNNRLKLASDLSDIGEESTVIIFDASDPFYLSSENGYLGYDGNELYGSLSVKDLSFIIENEQSRIKIVTDHCNNIEVSDIDEHISMDMFDNEDYKSVEGDSITSFCLEQDGDLKLNGKDFDFKAFTSNDLRFMNNENALAGISGHAQDDVTISKSGDDVHATSNEVVENITTSVMLSNEKYETYPTDDNRINIKTSSAMCLDKFGKVEIANSAYDYNGKRRIPSANVYCGDQLLNSDEDYTISCSNNKNVGKARVTITGNEPYSGTITKTFNIRPKGTKIKMPLSAKKSFTAKWFKQAKKMGNGRITGYQVRYSLSKDFSKGVKIKTVKGYKKASLKIKNLKSKKKYYVQVRTYKKVKGTKYYSKWSKTKAVKTK